MKTKIKKDAKKVTDLLLKSPKDSTIFTAGNGGSASIANHMACDWMKSTHKPKFTLRVVSLVSNVSLLSAISNDFGYEYSISQQIFWLAGLGDTVVLVSSSGNSYNIVEAAREANEKGVVVVGFTGFDGGELKKLCDISVHINSNDYGTVEDYHSQVMHEVVRQIKGRT